MSMLYLVVVIGAVVLFAACVWLVNAVWQTAVATVSPAMREQGRVEGKAAGRELGFREGEASVRPRVLALEQENRRLKLQLQGKGPDGIYLLTDGGVQG